LLTFGQLARHNARNYPAKTAYVDGDRRLDWARLNERACRLAQFMPADDRIEDMRQAGAIGAE